MRPRRCRGRPRRPTGTTTAARRTPAPHDQVRRQTPQEASDLFGPAWEQPATGTRPTRRCGRASGCPASAASAGSAARSSPSCSRPLALFFIGPMLLGIGGPGDGTGARWGDRHPDRRGDPVARADGAARRRRRKVYVVAKGDTISKIAKKNDVTVEQLLAANPQIKNPDKISIGDEITIPVPEEEDGGLEDGGGSPEP